MPGPKNDWQKLWVILKGFDWFEWNEWIFDWGISRFLVHTVLFAGLFSILSLQIPNIFLFAFGWLIGTAPIWLPIAMIIGFYEIWVWYARANFIFRTKAVLLEMKIPREITKSPRAMETALTNFWMMSGETTFFMRVFMGQVRPWYSLEITSFGGEIHFYVWVWKDYQSGVEGALYSQYPEIELHEVEDYSQKFVYNPDVQTCYGTGWRLEPYNPHKRYIDAYAFKTYIDLELDKDPKEEVKVDPFNTVLEFMGTMKPEQQIWIQILITSAFKRGKLVRKDNEWESQIRNEVQKIRALSLTFNEHEESLLTEHQLRSARPRPTWMQEHQLETMQRNLGKHPFEVVARGIFISPHKDFGRVYWNLRWIWRPFGNPQYMTQIRPRWFHNPMDYPWQDFHDMRWEILTRRCIDAYRRRSGFYSPWDFPSNIMTTEMIATIFHPPSSSAQVPGLIRISSKKAAPPPNLPQ